MKGLKVDQSGDLIIQNGKIVYVYDNDYIAQTVRLVLSTNQGEWEFDTNEGIDFYAMLRKNPNMDEVQDNIRRGLLQVDESFVIQLFEYDIDGRGLKIHFVATNDGNFTTDQVMYF